MVDISFNIDNTDVIDDVENAIERGMQRATEEIGDASVNVAKQRIREEGAIWTGDLLESFEIDYETSGDSLRVTIENTSDHASPLEYGAEYQERGPPVVALIPWVVTHMSGFSLPEESESPDEQELAQAETPDGDIINAYELADKETLNKAFWLQQHIKRHGLDAVEYMQEAREWARDAGARTTAEYIFREVQKV